MNENLVLYRRLLALKSLGRPFCTVVVKSWKVFATVFLG